MISSPTLTTASTFSTRSLAAPEIVDERPYALVIEPLCFYDERFGVAAIEYGPADGSIYEQLGAFFSASIKGLIMTLGGKNRGWQGPRPSRR